MKTLSGQSAVEKIGNKYYVGTNQGIWTSNDGLTWTQNQTDTLKTTSILGTIFESAQGSKFASTAGGVWKI